MNPVQGLLDSVAELQDNANVNAIFGAPVIVDECTVIPVAKVAYGFGMGVGYGMTDEIESDMGEDLGEFAEGVGGSGGAAVQARPFAVVQVTPEGVRVEPIVDEQKLAIAGSLLAGWSIFCLAKTLIKIFGQRE
ncbi:MAG: hypothetical protein GY832_25480 [Chloroflexi bacterium]|nr:hypothetical protein [Chloroflexota bacterium]